MEGRKEIKVLTNEEIDKMLMEGGIEQLYIRKKIDENKFECEITWLPNAEELKTTWKIDVWNCHGVLKKAEWGLGYGSMPDISPAGKYVDIGYFSIPVKHDVELTDEESEKLSKLLFEIIDRNGMINMSGFYPVKDEDIEKIKEIIGDKLYEGDKEDDFGNIKELIGNISDDEMNEIAFMLVKHGAEVDTLDELARKVEKHVKSEEGMKYLYFTLGRIEVFETLLEARKRTENLDMDEILSIVYANFLNGLKKKTIEYLKKNKEAECKEEDKHGR